MTYNFDDHLGMTFLEVCEVRHNMGSRLKLHQDEYQEALDYGDGDYAMEQLDAIRDIDSKIVSYTEWIRSNYPGRDIGSL